MVITFADLGKTKVVLVCTGFGSYEHSIAISILFLIEEETQSSVFSIYRLAHYCLDLAELMKTDRVIPVVIFLRRGNHQRELRLGSDTNTWLEFRYLACHLWSLPANRYYESANIVARLNLPNMAYA